MRKTYTNNQCHNCGTVLDQPKTGRTRFFCDDACKQSRYRFLKRQKEGRAKRHRKQTKTPSLYERNLARDQEPSAVRQLTQWLVLYQCPLCGRQFNQFLARGGQRRVYCSDECTRAARDRLKAVEKATAVAYRKGKGNETVMRRLEQGYLSPMCAHCGVPFPYRMLGGGRRRKYCTDQCRKAAYEKRYQKRYHGRKRKHRYANCPNCGERFDRVNSYGRLSKEFCGKNCQNAFADRRRRRERRLGTGRKGNRRDGGIRVRSEFRNDSERQSSGWEIGETAQDEHGEGGGMEDQRLGTSRRGNRRDR